MSEDRSCPCLYTTPCQPNCTCVKPFMSHGCYRCARYGSEEQRRKKAEALAEKIDGRIVRVGVAAIIRFGNKILMGKRKGSHGAGSWSFPGGHLEWNENVNECAAREVAEETGLPLYPIQYKPLTFTNDIFEVEGKHYITLYVEAIWNPRQFVGRWEPKVMEPDKCEEWCWMESPPDPLFLPVKNLLASGFKLWDSADGVHRA